MSFEFVRSCQQRWCESPLNKSSERAPANTPLSSRCESTICNSAPNSAPNSASSINKGLGFSDTPSNPFLLSRYHCNLEVQSRSSIKLSNQVRVFVVEIVKTAIVLLLFLHVFPLQRAML